MFSNWMQAAHDVKDGIMKQKKLVILYLAWSLICVYWGISNSQRMYDFYQIKISTADLLILQQHQWNFGIMLFPAAVFVVMKCKQDSLNIQFILRYGHRKRMLNRQIMESVVYAIGILLVLMGMEMVLAFSKTHSLINWSSTESLYYAQTGNVVSGNFLLIFISIFVMYLVKFMIILIVLDALLWYPKAIFMLWILLVLLAGIENLDVRFFYQFFAMQYIHWLMPWKYGITLGTGIIIMMFEYLMAGLLIKKRDIFR